MRKACERIKKAVCGFLNRLLNPPKKWFRRLRETVQNNVVLYGAFGIFYINLLLYMTYFLSAPTFQEDIHFLFKITEDGIFPLNGFRFTPIPAIIYLLLCAVGWNDDRLKLKCALVVLSSGVALIFSLFIIPLSLTIVFGYLVVIATVTVLLVFGEMKSSRQIPCLSLETFREKRDFILKRLEFEHEKWLSFFRESIWITITSTFALLSGVFLMLSTAWQGMPPAEENPFIYIFFRFQSLYFAGLLLYVLAGMLFGMVIQFHRQIVSVENLLEEYLHH